MGRAGWRNVVLLAAVSFLNDISAEMIMAVLPFVLIAQGASGLGLGLVGGVTEGLGHVTKLLGGHLGQRRPTKRGLIGGGYLVSGLSRFGVALAASWPVTLGFRSLDRVGKGLRTAPRDAMLAEQLPAAQRGRAFGLHRAADTAGAVVGVLLALVLVAVVGWEDQAVVLAGAAVGLTALLPLLGVNERKHADQQGATATIPEAQSDRFVPFLAVAAVFSLARVSYLFHLVRASAATGGVTAAIAWYLWFNVLYSAAAYPIGRLGDRIGRPRLLLAGYVLTAVASVAFVLEPSALSMAAGFTLLGLSFALVEGQGSALAADLAGSQRRSWRLGQYHALTGVATVAGGVAAGLLWDRVDPAAAFAWGAVLPLVAAVGLLLVRPPALPIVADAHHDH